jgi:hypothetical protein
MLLLEKWKAIVSSEVTEQRSIAIAGQDYLLSIF